MNFLLIANSLFTIYKFRMDLIKALQQKGHTVHVVAPEFEDPVIAMLEQTKYLKLLSQYTYLLSTSFDKVAY